MNENQPNMTLKHFCQNWNQKNKLVEISTKTSLHEVSRFVRNVKKILRFLWHLEFKNQKVLFILYRCCYWLQIKLNILRELNTKAKRWKRSFVFQVWNNLAKGPKSRKMGLHFTKNKYLVLQNKQLYLECFSYFFISTFVLLISEFFQSNPIY